jgi:hypothetical protein
MKQKDVALIIVIAFISGVISYFISGMLFSKPTDLKIEAETVEPISADFPPVDQRYFNANSINPTQLIQIGNQNNTQPF